MSMVINPARFGAVAFSPLDIAGLQAWYDADRETASNHAATGNLTDRSGNGFTATQNDTNYTLEYAQQNGRKVIRTGNSAPASTPTYTLGTSLMNGKTAGSMFAVLKANADPNTNTPSGVSGGATSGILSGFSSTGFGAHFPYTDSNIYEPFGTSVRKNWNPTPGLAAWRIYGVTSAANDFKAYLDGTATFTTATNTVNFGSATTKYLGSSNNTTNHFKWFGDFGEVLIYDTALSQANREKVEGYLAHRWGLAGSLDVSHPYKSAPP